MTGQAATRLTTAEASGRILDAVRVYPLARAHPTAIVVQCSDSRFQAAFRSFAADELHLGEADVMPLVVGGGAGVLAHPERLPKEFRFVRERLEFYRSVAPSLRRLVLINHDDCLYYRALKQRVLGASFLSPAGRAHDDLAAVRAVLSRRLPNLGLEVELYFARFADAEQTLVSFERTRG